MRFFFSRRPEDHAELARALVPVAASRVEAGGMSGAQREFMSSTNAAAVESVVNEIETQVVPGVAKRVLKEWTSTVVTMNQ
jgi:hypothetical protein